MCNSDARHSLCGGIAMTDADYMQSAIKKAKEGVEAGQAPFGACIVKPQGDAIISCEHNVVWSTTDSTAHAEITAIRAACKTLNTIDLSGCVLYSTCEPCPMCFAAAHWAKISKIIYGARIEDARDAGFSELEISNETLKQLSKSHVVLEKDFLRDEAIELFSFWKQISGKSY